MNASTDRIERTLLLPAPRARVWAALADAEAFGRWFGVDLRGQRFVAGERTVGAITHPGYEHLRMDVQVQRVEPERRLSFHWHPYPIDPDADYSQEAPTRVEFGLEDADGGTRLHVVESGFDAIPAARRDEAYRMNSEGWDQQLENLARFLG